MITSVVLDVKVTGACCAITFGNARRKTNPDTISGFILLLPLVLSICRYGGYF
jgi:hypothetical protein